jgi:hypothetical protein
MHQFDDKSDDEASSLTEVPVAALAPAAAMSTVQVNAVMGWLGQVHMVPGSVGYQGAYIRGRLDCGSGLCGMPVYVCTRARVTSMGKSQTYGMFFKVAPVTPATNLGVFLRASTVRGGFYIETDETNESWVVYRVSLTEDSVKLQRKQVVDCVCAGVDAVRSVVQVGCGCV